MTETEMAEANAREQARYKFLILGVYPTGHGVTERWVAPAEVIAACAEIRRNGAEPVIASVFKDGRPIEWPAAPGDIPLLEFADNTATWPLTPTAPQNEFGVAVPSDDATGKGAE